MTMIALPSADSARCPTAIARVARELRTVRIFARVLSRRFLLLVWLLWMAPNVLWWMFWLNRRDMRRFDLVPGDPNFLLHWWGNTLFATVLGVWLGITVFSRMSKRLKQVGEQSSSSMAFAMAILLNLVSYLSLYLLLRHRYLKMDLRHQ